MPTEENNKSEFVFAIFIFLIIISYTLFRDESKFQKLKDLISDNYFWISFAMVVIWSIYWFYISKKHKYLDKYKTATKQAIIGLIIALFAHLELVIAPFWFVWITAFFLNVSS